MVTDLLVRGRHAASLTFRPRAVALILAVVWGIYLGVLHPWLMNWGATAEEQRMSLPGDDPRDPPSAYFTRAITIEAPPAVVWQWLLQIGQDRAGFYSYTWLENLTGANIHNGDELRPEWQQRAVGDRVPMARPDLWEPRLGEAMYLRIVAAEPGRMIANLPGRFVLLPLGDGATRLLLREPIGPPGDEAGQSTLGTAVSWLAWDPVHFVMEQRMLRGIKERAEGRPLVPPEIRAVARVGWVLAGVGLFGALGVRSRWRPWLIVPVVLVVPPAWAAGDLDAGLAGFLAIGITVLGALGLGRRWWLPFLLLASAVLLILLLAPDAYAAFGLLFLLAGVGAAARWAPRATRDAPQFGTLVPPHTGQSPLSR
jgi:hypothetical protein